MRAALYVRVSTDKQEADNQSLQLREYCKRVGYQIMKEYRDVMSGAETRRPEYNLMFDDASKHLFDVVVFWDISRFSRSGPSYTLQKLQQLDNLGIAWESYQEQYFRSLGPFKEAVIAIMAAVAKMEREKISERTKAGLARAREQGKLPGRPKGSQDKKPRRKKGYYDNTNWRKKSAWTLDDEHSTSNNRGSNPLPSITLENQENSKERKNAPLSEKED